MTWCDKSSCDNDHHMAIICDTKANEFLNITCPSCGHNFGVQDQSGGIQALPGLPAGVKFDPTDQEILEHLEAKVLADKRKLHPLINEFIPTIEGENGICYTHPENLPGVSNDGQVRHFFHRPSKAYTTGTRKRRKVHSDEEDGSETRWHKTGKTRPVLISGGVKGFKKILVLYTNYGRQKKPEKTNWVMHQYHLGNSEEEKEGELVLSKVFYQTQPRQCGTSNNNSNNVNDGSSLLIDHQNRGGIDYYGGNDPHLVIYGGGGDTETSNRHPYQLIANHVLVQGDGSSLFRLAADTSKGKLQRKY